MLQADEPADYVIGSGVAHSVLDVVHVAFEHVGLAWEDHVVTDPSLFRPAEVDVLIADATKAHRDLGWEPQCAFEDMIRGMVEADIERVG